MASKEDPQFYLEISRIDDEKREVEAYGIRGDMKDSFGTIIDLDRAVACMADYMEYPAIREMHQPIAAGKAINWEADEKGIKVVAKIVDDDAWNKVKEGVYRGFSVGGKQDYTVRNGKNIGRVRPDKWQEDDVVFLKSITEHSLVDSPSNRGCGDMVHRISNHSNIRENNMDKTTDEETVAEALERVEGAGDSTETVEEEEVKRYAGEEINDCATALSALQSIMWLLCMESGETHPEAEEQKASLKTAIEALKKFITSEIKEVTTETTTSTETLLLELAAGEADDAVRVEEEVLELTEEVKEVERKGAAISAANKSKSQAIHDHAVSLGATCPPCERCSGISKAEGESDDIKRVAALEEDVIRLKEATEVLRTKNEEQVARIAELEKEPAEAKAKTMAIDRRDDVGLNETEKVTRLEDTAKYKDASEVERRQLKAKEELQIALTKPVAFYR